MAVESTLSLLPLTTSLLRLTTVSAGVAIFVNQECFGSDLDGPAPGDRLSLCRILVVVTEILDVPRAFLEEAAARSRPLQLRYELLGQREVIRLENPVAGEVLGNAGGGGAVGAAARRTHAGERGGGQGSRGRREGQEEDWGALVPISVNHFRYTSSGVVCYQLEVCCIYILYGVPVQQSRRVHSGEFFFHTATPSKLQLPRSQDWNAARLVPRTAPP